MLSHQWSPWRLVWVHFRRQIDRQIYLSTTFLFRLLQAIVLCTCIRNSSFTSRWNLTEVPVRVTRNKEDELELSIVDRYLSISNDRLSTVWQKIKNAIQRCEISWKGGPKLSPFQWLFLLFKGQWYTLSATKPFLMLHICGTLHLLLPHTCNLNWPVITLYTYIYIPVFSSLYQSYI